MGQTAGRRDDPGTEESYLQVPPPPLPNPPSPPPLSHSPPPPPHPPHHHGRNGDFRFLPDTKLLDHPCQPSSSSKHIIVPLTPTTNNDLHSIILAMSRASSPVTNQSATCSFNIHIKVGGEKWKTTNLSQ